MKRLDLQSALALARRSRSGRSASRTNGDRARDRGDWNAAIVHYREHLVARPLDDAIRVQLGHALKENGLSDEAMLAYHAVLERRPNDADLLLSIGHLHKLRGEPEAAVSFYRRSAEENGNHHALAEIDYLNNIVAMPPSPDAAIEVEHVLDLLCTRSTGLVPVAGNDIVAPGDHEADRIHFMAHDPWIVFELDKAIAASGGLAVLAIDVEPLDEERPLSGQLYVDYGEGFDEKTSLPFVSDGTPVTLLLAAPERIRRVRWDPDRKPNAIRHPKLTFRSVDDFTVAEALIRKRASADLDVEPLIDLARACFDSIEMTQREAAEASLMLMVSDFDLDAHYRRWLFRYERPSEDDYAIIARMTQDMAVRPKFSFVMPTYNTPNALLRDCLDSMLAQTYADFEICVADDHSTDPDVERTLAEYAARDSRVKYVRSPRNGHISETSNRALRLATGDFIVLVDHDDAIPDYALFVVAHYVNIHPDADVLFSDEDKIGMQNYRFAPYFKGMFNKFLMYGHNMVSHLGVYRRSLVEEVGGFRLGLEGSQDYDLLLRCYERSRDDRIIHIPHILYHWRTTPGSTAIAPDQKSYAIVAAELAINGHFERTGMPLRSTGGFSPGCTGVRPAYSLDTPVSIIIPTRNGLDVLKPCIDSVLAAAPENVEILVVDNGTDDPATSSYLASLETSGVARVLPYDAPFNFSRINNLAAEHATGDILCFLNNDTELLARDWLARARALLAIDEVGIVGARLLYPDRTLQHFGIALGMGKHGIAGTPHGGFGETDPGYFGKARLMQEFSAVTAACMFVRRSVFEDVGGFEPELSVAYNDIDLCLKVRARGLKVVGDPDILLIHKESKTRGSDKTGERAERLQKEAEWMRARWSDVLADDPYYSSNLSLERLDFAPAAPPRVPMPWRAIGTGQAGTGQARA